jgi:hypothetical protein
MMTFDHVENSIIVCTNNFRLVKRYGNLSSRVMLKYLKLKTNSYMLTDEIIKESLRYYIKTSSNTARSD